VTQRDWDNVEVGERLPLFEDVLTFTRVASAPAATLDWYPLHHDPEFARANGQPGVVLSTVQLMGLVDRVVTDWAGPTTFVRRREIRLLHSVFACDVLFCTGTVTAKDDRDLRTDARGWVSVDVEVKNADGLLCCAAAITIEIPGTT
jgi:acyl dehydratase